MSGTCEELSEMSTLSQIIDDEQMAKITANFTRLNGRAYLENAGTTLYPQCLLAKIHEDLMNNVYSNPHSDSYSKDCVDQIRSMILHHFNTDSTQYTVVFTSGTTQSLKLVVESFHFQSDTNDLAESGSFVYLRDNHTSVLGLREIAADKGAEILHLSREDFLAALKKENANELWRAKLHNGNTNTLFVYPAQSNFNGYKYPINQMEEIKAGCLNSVIKKYLGNINRNWYVLLDVASFVSSNRLDLSKTKPDFVGLSFYKIFGYPTGLGCLLIKNSSQHVLNQKKYFGGGTVDVVLSTEDFHAKRKNLYERLEDGTVSFLSIISLKHCFDTMYNLIPKIIYDDIMETISYHTFYLAKDLYYQLLGLTHRNGQKAAILYMDSEFNDIKQQGGTVTFNLVREDGSAIGYSEFQHMADLFNISVRTGCFCNSGSCQRHLLTTNREIKEMYKAGHVCGDKLDIMNGRPTGAVRASFGYFNTFKDVDKLIDMICQCFVKVKLKPPKRNVHINHRTVQEPNRRREATTKYKFINQQEFFSNNNDSEDKSKVYSTIISVTEVAIFPIKSCGAFKIHSSWRIGPKGFEFDREWMIIRHNGVCLTQKQNSRMCMITPTIDLTHRVMTLMFQGKSSITVPLDCSSYNNQRMTSFCQSKICTDTVEGYDCGDEVGDWISEVLEVSFLRLIRQSNRIARIQKTNQDGDKKLLSLSNQAQFLLINKATVQWLREKIQDSVFIDNIDELTDRFRGNIIIDMDEALVERDWQRVIIGNQEFRVEGQCQRCQMVCIDQKTGKKTVEPLRTISKEFAGKLRFGIYLTYIGAADGSEDRVLNVKAPVTPVIKNENITR